MAFLYFRQINDGIHDDDKEALEMLYLIISRLVVPVCRPVSIKSENHT